MALHLHLVVRGLEAQPSIIGDALPIYTCARIQLLKQEPGDVIEWKPCDLSYHDLYTFPI